MKSSKSPSFPLARRALIASAVALLVGAGPAWAQADKTNYGSSQKPASTDSTANADVKATRDVNSEYATSSSTNMAGHDKLGWGDKRFVTKAAESGEDEVQLAQLASERAANAEVRNFAQKLVTEHQEVNSELTQMAGQKNVKLDNDKDKDRAYKRLSKKSGADFDHEFVEHMIDEHEKDIKMFEKASTSAKDPDVRSFAAKNIDHLRQHLQQAQSLRQTLMPTGRMDENSGRSTPGGNPSTTPDSTSTGKTYDSTTTPSTHTPSTTTPDTSSSTTRRDTSR